MGSLRKWALTLIVPVLMLGVSACASSQDDAILTQLSKIEGEVAAVKTAAAAPAEQHGVTKDEIAALVNSALADATAAAAPAAGVSKAEVEELIDTAVTKAATAAAASAALAGVSSADVEAIVAEQVGGLKIPDIGQYGTMPDRLLAGPVNFTFSMVQTDDNWDSIVGDASIGSLNDLTALGKPIVVNFLAAGCPPCWKELPAMQKVYDEYQGDIILLGVDVGPNVGMQANPKLGDRDKLVTEHSITFPLAEVETAKVVVMYGFYRIPSSIFVTAGGKLLHRDTKAIDEETFRARVQDLLGVSAS